MKINSFFLNDLHGPTGHNFQSRAKNEKDFERTYQNLVNYVGILRNIDFYKNGVNLKKKYFFHEKISRKSVIKSLNFDGSKKLYVIH